MWISRTVRSMSETLRYTATKDKCNGNMYGEATTFEVDA